MYRVVLCHSYAWPIKPAPPFTLWSVGTFSMVSESLNVRNSNGLSCWHHWTVTWDEESTCIKLLRSGVVCWSSQPNLTIACSLTLVIFAFMKMATTKEEQQFMVRETGSLNGKGGVKPEQLPSWHHLFPKWWCWGQEQWRSAFYCNSQTQHRYLQMFLQTFAPFTNHIHPGNFDLY